MAGIAAIFLAHLNPFTNAHETIISGLKGKGYHVYVFPVRFLRDGKEINTRSFPFSYEVRKEMVESVFGAGATVSPNYAFHAPYSKYLPPLFSRSSWRLRRDIIEKIAEDRFVSYTGDAAERLMLWLYRLNPVKASRLELSASSVKDLLYRQVLDEAVSDWHDKVPKPVTEIINKNWNVVEKFARLEDRTKRVMGMKFPNDGFK